MPARSKEQTSNLLSPNKLTLVEDWQMPISKLKKGIIEDLEKMETDENVKTSEKNTRELFRVIAEDIHQQVEKPGRLVLSEIAKKICAKYPAFSDSHGANKIGSGHSTVRKKIEERIANLNRPKKKSEETPKDPTIELETGVKVKRMSVGCKNFAPTLNAVSCKQQELIIKDLKNLHTAGTQINEKIIKSMKEAFPFQRRLILKSLSSAEIKDMIPYLFNPIIFLDHFEYLTGSDVQAIYDKIMEDKDLHHNFFATHKLNTNPIFTEIEKAKLKLNNDKPMIGYGLLAMAASYFKEPCWKLYLQVEVSVSITLSLAIHKQYSHKILFYFTIIFCQEVFIITFS